jgi:hypothetical protein
MLGKTHGEHTFGGIDFSVKHNGRSLAPIPESQHEIEKNRLGFVFGMPSTIIGELGAKSSLQDAV